MDRTLDLGQRKTQQYPSVAKIALFGEGRIHAAVRRNLAADFSGTLRETTIDECSLALVLDDGWNGRLYHESNEDFLRRGVPWLRVGTEMGKAMIGPCTFPYEPGCHDCAETRRLTAGGKAGERSTLLGILEEDPTRDPRPMLTGMGVETISRFVIDEAKALAIEPGRARTSCGLVALELSELDISIHTFLPDPLCPSCGRTPEDDAKAAAFSLRSREKVSVQGYRTRSLAAEKERLLATYVDPVTGIIDRLDKDTGSVFPNVHAPMSLRRKSKAEPGFGRKLDYETGQLTAITEALERYGGVRPGGKRTSVRGTYDEFGDQAVDPTTLGLHSEEEYGKPNHHYQRYHHDLEFNWVWAYSFRNKAPILLPENYAYYGMLYGRVEDRPFVYEISNGCALGGCLEEAILYGILEVAERDAFLMTWYASLEVPEVDLATVPDSTVALMAERIEHETGYTVRLFNTTLDHGIPCFWVAAVDDRGRSGFPKVLCAAGSHLDPTKGMVNAMLELAPMIASKGYSYSLNRERSLAMVMDPYSVVHMDDHSLLYSAPEAFDRFDFLLGTNRSQDFQDVYGGLLSLPSDGDLLHDLEQVATGYLERGLDIVVVDQTTPEHSAGGFSCVKVVIPGTLPMTFGHRNRRVDGLQRLYRVPCELGYRPKPISASEVNPHPHPFP